MKKLRRDDKLEPVTSFHGLRLPELTYPVGYAGLIDLFDLRVPLPRELCAIGTKRKAVCKDGWRLFPPPRAPVPTLAGHLNFALKWEGVDLAVLGVLFEAVPANDFRALILDQPTSQNARRIWFLYEWFTGRELDIPEPKGRKKYVCVIDPKLQYAVEGTRSQRHRVINNLPGTRDFCPLVFRTEKLEAFLGKDLAARAREIVDQVPKDLLARTAAFLLLKDSRSSYAIEGERPPQDRIQRWGRAIGEAGQNPLELDELLRLQEIVIGDARFVKLGLRKEGGFIGEHDRSTRMPLPEHIDARHEDLASLIAGMLAFDNGPAQELDGVIAAAILAFGFVYIHPFEDGNGRLHRYLIHHVLAQRGFNPSGVVFPVSAAILEAIENYEAVLSDYSQRLLPVIDWEPTDNGNVHVLNDTGDFYRFFDATVHAEFLYDCVRKTIEEDLPAETSYLRSYDHFALKVGAIVDMPHRTIDMLFHFLRQNDGVLSSRARSKEFAALTDDEVSRVQDVYDEAFAN